MRYLPVENQLPTQASLLQTGKRSLWAWLAQPGAPPGESAPTPFSGVNVSFGDTETLCPL